MFLPVQILSLAAFLLPLVSALPTVSRAGRFLYTPDGNRFYIKGVAYQPQGAVAVDPNAPFSEPSTFDDPLADSSGCARDIPFLKQLTVNTVRVYSVDSSLNHDSCMQGLSSAGIYTIIDLSLPLNGSMDRNAPSWTTNLLDQYINTIQAFSKYDNVLGYNVGNEIIVAANGTGAAAFIKAAARDTKAFLKSQNSGALVGYAAIDADRSWLLPLANYLSCDSETDSLDIFGLNNYEWCGDDTFAAAYSGVESDFASYNIPAYFSEYGCITSPPRLWTEVDSLFSSQMSPVWSGGIAFSYFPAQSDQGQFGLVTISGNTVTTTDDFDRLQDHYSNVSAPNSPTMSGAGATNYPACPAQSANFLASTTLPPTPSDAACQCVVNNLSCQFTPQTSNTTVIVGQLLDTACGLVGQQGGNCNDIAGSGSAGTYGRVSFCDPASKLSFVMTEFYELTDRNAQSCNFAGNATINTNAPSTDSALNSAVSQCLSGAAVTFTPTASGSPPSSSPTKSGGSTPKSGAAMSLQPSTLQSLFGFGCLITVGIASGLWTLV